MKVWFVSTLISEYDEYNDAEPGTDDYEYETEYEPLFCSPLYATEKQAINERNRLFLEAYEEERKAHTRRLKQHNARKEAVDILSLAGISPEDLFPYGIGESPQFYPPTCARVGYLEVVEEGQ